MSQLFGKLSAIAKPCRWHSRYGRVQVAGGAGSGKTLGSIRMAAGMRRGEGVIVLVSCDEQGAEELYAGVTEFTHIDIREAHKLMGITPPVGGVSSVVLNNVLREVSANIPPGSVIIIDSGSAAWDGTKALVRQIQGSNPTAADTNNAWNAAGVEWDGVMELISGQTPITHHVIVTLRAKTESTTVGKGKSQRRFETVKEPDTRNRDKYRLDVRIELTSEHVPSISGRLDSLNQRPPRQLDESFGARLAGYLATGSDPGNRAVDVNTLPAAGSEQKAAAPPSVVDDFLEQPRESQQAEVIELAKRKGLLGEEDGQVTEEAIKSWAPKHLLDARNRLRLKPDPIDPASKLAPGKRDLEMEPEPKEPEEDDLGDDPIPF